MCMHKQWLHCTRQWGQEMPLSEHVYCVDVAFKMTERIEQWTCLKFCVQLEHSSMETMPMIQGHSYGQRVIGSFIMKTYLLMNYVLGRVLLLKHQITQVTQPPYSPDLAPCGFYLFPKLKSPLKGKRFKTIIEIQENTMGQMMVTGRTVWGSKVPNLKATEVSLSMFLISCVFFNKCLYFPY